MASRLFRILIAWLMLLALPLQGLAAAGGWPCHAAGERQRVALEVHGQGHAHEHTHHAGHAGGPTSASRHAHAPSPDDGADGARVSALAGCAACANCAHALGLASAWPPLGAAVPPAPPLDWVLPHWPLPDWPVPDKPPRT